jgi:hypothetical protein
MFVPGRLFQPSLMFVGKTRNLLKTGAPERCFTLAGSGLTYKYYTRLERLATDKQSSLVRTLVNSEHKFFITLDTGSNLL